MDQKAFRSITPIFNFTLGTDFSHSGAFKEASFNISLRKYEPGKKSYDELMKYADKTSRSQLTSIHIYTKGPMILAEFFLVVDVIHPSNEDLKVSTNSYESVHILKTILDSLRLHSSNGLLCDKTFYFSFPQHSHGGTAYGSPLINQNPFLHLNGLSVLRESEFEKCRSTFDILLNKKWNNNVTLDKLLVLAIEYHKAVFSFQAIEHGFLILMVIFEALFKKDNNENRTQASMRISKLISVAKKDQKKIHKEFSVDTNNFYDLRNNIAHGDPSLDQAVIKTKYKALYQYITMAIIKLISITDGQVNHGVNYYDEVTRLIDRHFNSLPST